VSGVRPHTSFISRPVKTVTYPRYAYLMENGIWSRIGLVGCGLMTAAILGAFLVVNFATGHSSRPQSQILSAGSRTGSELQ
jgi:hypothetical protein